MCLSVRLVDMRWPNKIPTVRLGHHQEHSNVIETPLDPCSDETPTGPALLNSSLCNCNSDVLTILLEKLNKHCTLPSPEQTKHFKCCNLPIISIISIITSDTEIQHIDDIVFRTIWYKHEYYVIEMQHIKWLIIFISILKEEELSIKIVSYITLLQIVFIQSSVNIQFYSLVSFSWINIKVAITNCLF